MSIYSDDTIKQLKFFKGSTDITGYVLPDSFECEDILTDEQLNFGSANSARVQFETTEDLSLAGLDITVTWGTESEFVQIGKYKVTYTSHKDNSSVCKITAYDSMKNFDVNVADWYVGLTFPITLKNFRDSLCDYIGIEQVTVSLVNDSMPIERTISPSKLNGIDVLKYIGQINGVFPHSTNEGKLDYISLGTESKTVSQSVINGADGVVKKNYYTSAISKLVINSEDGDIGVSVGDGSNIFYVTANILVYGKSIAELTAIGQNLLNKIGGNTYVPMTLNMKYLPDLKLGDRIVYQGYGTYVLSRKSSGILFDVIKADGTEKLKEDTSITTEIEQLRGKSNVLTRDIEKTSLKIDDVEAGLSNEITQTANALKLQIEELSKEIGGDAEIYVTNEVPTLENYPANTFHEQIFPADDLYPSDDLVWHYTYESYKRHLGSSVFVQGSSVSYKFTANDNGTFKWTAIEDSQLSFVMNRLTSLEVRTDGIEATVGETVSTVSSQGQQISQNTSSINAQAGEISSKVSTTTYNADKKTITDNIDNLDNRVSSAESSITQQASAISARVTYAEYNSGMASVEGQISLKIDKSDNNQIVSMLNMSANEINLNSNRLTWTSDYSEMDKYGRIKIKGPTMTASFEGGEVKVASNDGITTAFMQGHLIQVSNNSGNRSYMSPYSIGTPTVYGDSVYTNNLNAKTSDDDIKINSNIVLDYSKFIYANSDKNMWIPRTNQDTSGDTTQWGLSRINLNYDGSTSYLHLVFYAFPFTGDVDKKYWIVDVPISQRGYYSEYEV